MSFAKEELSVMTVPQRQLIHEDLTRAPSQQPFSVQSRCSIEGSGMVAKIDQVRRGEVRTALGHDYSGRLDSERKDAPDRHGEDGASQGI